MRGQPRAARTRAAASVTSESVAGGGGIRRSIPLSVSLSISLSIRRVAVYDGAEGRLIPVGR